MHPLPGFYISDSTDEEIALLGGHSRQRAGECSAIASRLWPRVVGYRASRFTALVARSPSSSTRVRRCRPERGLACCLDVDLYQCHVPDPYTPIEETMSALDDFVRSGKVRYVGCSNFTVGQLYQSHWAAHTSGSTGFVCLQAHYSLLARAIEAEILPACEDLGLGTITYGPLANGLLTGRYRKCEPPVPGSRMHQWLHYDNPAAGDGSKP